MTNLPSLRCKKCGKLLCKGIIKVGIIEMKCPKCGTYNVFTIRELLTETSRGTDEPSKEISP